MIPSLALRIEGSGPPLVMLHGGMGSWTHWIRNIPALAPHFSVYTPDLWGCGDSPTPPEDITEEAYAEAVAGYVDRLARGARLRLVGFSFGGITAAMVAARLGDRIERLTLIAPGGFGTMRERKLDLRKLPERGGDPAERIAVLKHNLRVMMFAREQTADEATLAIHQKNVRRGRFDSRRLSLSPFLPPSLERIRCPLQLIYGDRDNLAYPSIEARLERVRAIRPDARVDLLPDAGHWVMYEAAEAFNAALLGFMR